MWQANHSQHTLTYSTRTSIRRKTYSRSLYGHINPVPRYVLIKMYSNIMNLPPLPPRAQSFQSAMKD